MAHPSETPFPAQTYSSIVGANSIGVQTVKPAYDKVLDFKLRSMPLFRNASTEFKRVSDLTNPGSTVTFTLWNYMDAPEAGDTNLHEYNAPQPALVPQGDVVSVTLDEFGDLVTTTKLLRTFSFADVDAGAAALVAARLADDVDNRVRAKLDAGTNVVYSDGGAPSLSDPGLTDGPLVSQTTPGDNFSSRIARFVSTRMRKTSALPVGEGGEYLAFIHPDIEHDIRSETSAGGWRTPHEYSAAGNIWTGRIGIYEGLLYVTTPRCTVTEAGNGADSEGEGGDNVYHSYIMGNQALAEAIAVEPSVVVTDTFDPFRRHWGLGYYGIAGWGVYRQDCLWRVETTSTVSDSAMGVS